ncbi:PAS domain S-box protein [Halarchaeum sp. P4]|uniref:PAS domain S-box protein n=1 Tax=Halarchaeum sp. P4 TaxID=3421639 RepID=UPI003EB718BB
MSEEGTRSATGFRERLDPDAVRRRSRALFETVDDGVYHLDATGRLLDVNDVASERLGYDRGDLAGSSIDRLLKERDAARVRTRLEEGDTTTLDVELRTADGEAVPRTLRVTPVGDGESAGAVVVAEERDSEPVRGREHTHLDRVFDASPVGISALDPDGDVITVNDRAAELLGCDADDANGEHDGEPWTLYDGDGAEIPPSERPFERAVESRERVENVEARVERPDGEDGWLSFSAAPVETADGDLSMVIVTVEDATERMERERQLRRERNQTRRLIETTPVAIAVKDEAGDPVLANKRAKQFLKLPDDDLEDAADHDGWTAYDADGARLERSEMPPARVFETGDAVFEEEIALESPEGERRWYRVNAAPIRDEDGSVERVVAAGEDVTELKERERRLQRRTDELEAELSEVFGRVSDAFFALDEEFRFTHLNEQAHELINPEGRDLRGERLWEAFPQAIERGTKSRYERALHEQETVTFEEYASELDTWFEVRVYPSETGLSVYFRDITERREREDALAESEQRYRALAENFPNGLVTLFDEDLEYTLAAGRGFEDLHVDAADVEGEHFSDVWHDAGAAQIEPMLRGALDGERSSDEVTYAGREWWFDAIPITDDDGDVFAGMTVAQDISERKEREQELAKYETIVETISDGIYVADEDGYFTTVNDAFAEMTGYDRSELVGAHASLIVDDDALERAAEIRASMAEGEVTRPAMEATVTTADGDTVPTEAAFASLPTEEGERRVGVVRDISQRIEHRQQIEESERRYRTLVENFPKGAVGLFDEDAHYTAVGGRLVDDIGIDPDEHVGQSATDVYPAEIGETLETHFEAALDGEASQFEFEADDRYLTARTLPIEDDDGVHAGMLVVQDVTEREEMERELRESEAKFRTLAENLEETVWMTTPDTTEMLYINPAFEDIWGRERETLYEDPHSFVETVHPEDRERVREAYSRLPEESYDEVFRIQHPEKGTRWVHARAGPVVNECDGVSRVVGIAEDVTERTEYERALERQRERLAALNELNDVVHGVTEAVINRSTRRKIEETACENLVASESYECAWVGAPDPRSQTVTVRATAGGDAVLDDVELSTDPDVEDPHLASRALRTGEIQTSHDCAAAECDSVHEVASAAAIPIAHEETVYGVLTVYADREDAFWEEERDVISHLGEIVGHAIAAAERKRALLSETVVELEFRLRDAIESLDEVGGADGTISLERAIPVSDDEFLIYGVADESDVETMDAMTESVAEWDAVSVVSEQSDGVRFELRVSDVPVMSEVASLGGAIESVLVDGRDLDMTVHLPEDVEVRRVIETIQDTHDGAEAIAQRRVPAHDDSLERLHAVWSEDLTERQRTVVETAYFAGFFEWPRAANGSDVADALDISSPTFSQHLRAAQNKVFGRLLDEDDELS